MNLKRKEIYFAIFYFLFVFIPISVFSQTNAKDESVDIVGYWNLNEKLNYTIDNRRYKITSNDSAKTEYYKYSVELFVKDSASKSYQFEWVYSRFETNIENKVLQKLKQINEGLKVKVITTEIGQFVGIANYEEIKQKVKPLFSAIKAEFKDTPGASQLIKEHEAYYNSKDALENVAFKDIHQYYTFYGETYKVNLDVKGKAMLRNNFGGDPLNASLLVKLSEIDKEDKTNVIKLVHTIDSKQAKTAVSDAGIVIGNEKSKNFVPNSTEPFSYIEKVTSRFHAPTGWVLYSGSSNEISSGKSKNIDEIVFKIK
jgi:hypothetical protein